MIRDQLHRHSIRKSGFYSWDGGLLPGKRPDGPVSIDMSGGEMYRLEGLSRCIVILPSGRVTLQRSTRQWTEL